MTPAADAPIHVLIVDDEPAIRRALRVPLTGLGFLVTEVSRGEEALDETLSSAFDAVLLDLNMPGLGGMETLVRLRARHPRLPVLVLTVQDAEDRKVEALDLGADDYITKPFSTRECIARLRSAVRRSRTPETAADAPIRIGDLELRPAERALMKAGRPIRLTPKEYAMLFCLMSRAGRVVTYSKLLTEVWGGDYSRQIDYLRTFVRQLRVKIEDDPSRPRYLETDSRIGYRFRADSERSSEP